jgi:5S rRNA maturation endonuclease (ribonuclease M5)
MAVRGLSMGGSRQWITDRGLWLKGSLPLAVTFEITKLLSNKLRIPSKLLSGNLAVWVTPVRRYALKRGITEAQRFKWDICYAIDGAMGGRIVFPVKDEKEEWLGWHARTFCNQDKRYKNASEGDGFDPGAIFGMRHWPPPDERQGLSLVLTEGALDALACERAGAKFLAAVGGSEPHARQLLKLQQWERILVATDGDDAGDRLYRTIKFALGTRVDVRRVEIPRNADAAELTREVLKVLLWQAESERNQSRSSRGSVVRRRLVLRSGFRR